MVERNLNAYQKSITDELKATQDRVRNLIGEAHWLTDGEHKEVLKTPQKCSLARCDLDGMLDQKSEIGGADELEKVFGQRLEEFYR